MTWILWDTIFLISGSFFSLGVGPNNSTVIEGPNTTSRSASAISTGGTTISTAVTPKTAIPPVKGLLSTLGADLSSPAGSGDPISRVSTIADPTAAPDTSRSGSAATAAANATTNTSPVKKFVAAAVRSHFDDCPDTHRHFCFHGTCRFLVLEETPACVCHAGFVGVRCEHADLLAVVATNHRQQTVATALVMCVVGCVLVMLLCALLHCWWRQDCRRRRHAHHVVQQKRAAAASPYSSESVV
ncbi:protransforming growth factor alpha [Nelusetta ayraudi]|uniref:protransforming growth factor alpha n=1 Tax=Nelusetta ayraudi TaxID=303726 RepID=UPI003F717C67